MFNNYFFKFFNIINIVKIIKCISCVILYSWIGIILSSYFFFFKYLFYFLIYIIIGILISEINYSFIYRYSRKVENFWKITFTVFWLCELFFFSSLLICMVYASRDIVGFDYMYFKNPSNFNYLQNILVSIWLFAWINFLLKRLVLNKSIYNTKNVNRIYLIWVILILILLYHELLYVYNLSNIWTKSQYYNLNNYKFYHNYIFTIYVLLFLKYTHTLFYFLIILFSNICNVSNLYIKNLFFSSYYLFLFNLIFIICFYFLVCLIQ